MENTISNLTQKEFDIMMKESQMNNYKEDLELLKEVVKDYFGENLYNFKGLDLLEMSQL